MATVSETVTGIAMSVVTSVYAKMWGEAVPEQQRLTVQLFRNSFYFTTSIILIAKYGEFVCP